MNCCQTKGCKNKALNRKYCNTCRSRRYRNENPIRTSYINLKSNAKRRGKEFKVQKEVVKGFDSEENSAPF